MAWLSHKKYMSLGVLQIILFTYTQGVNGNVGLISSWVQMKVAINYSHSFLVLRILPVC
jgi:hypothetical protein